MADMTRRAQLIAPFGVGAISVLKSGTAVMTAGLDAWFREENANRDEYAVSELRLAASLGVRALYLPPDYRQGGRFRSADRQNTRLTVPFQLLPTWHFCPKCRRMVQLPLHYDATGRGQVCTYHEDIKPEWRRPRVQQVRFLIMCEEGHADDFPWLEWVHRSIAPTCTGPLLLRVVSGASLSAIQVSCEGNCGAKPRNLAGIMSAQASGETELSKTLSASDDFLCRGLRPWLGNSAAQCGGFVRATLRSATNLHFGRVRSAIYLPPEATPTASASRLVAAIEHQKAVDPNFRSTYDMFRQLGADISARTSPVRMFLDAHGESGWIDAQIAEAIQQVDARADSGGGTVDAPAAAWSEVTFRRQEYEVLRSNVETDELVVRASPPESYDAKLAAFSRFFTRVSLVHKLRETRAYFGFTRVRPNERIPVAQARGMLSRDPLQWLPAYVVRGEGIFLQLREDTLVQWEQTVSDARHLAPMEGAFARLVTEDRVTPDLRLTPRFVLLHTLAHTVINRLVFDCGYSSASLRERLYVSSEHDRAMAGVLIYTAAGDSEGTMGGLVEMGRPGALEAVLLRALEAASWCSLDPVCMEVGERNGQGPDSCNLAACHSCALVPETSCEQFNRFLDRGLLIGTPSRPNLGFFTPLVRG